MHSRKVFCKRCGRDITKSYKFYIDGEAFCYDCADLQTKKRKKEKKPRKKKEHSLESVIRREYRFNRSVPSYIAEKYNVTVEDVYRILNGEKLRGETEECDT